jgi:hypothetical protein
MVPTQFTALMAHERELELRHAARSVRAGRPARRLRRRAASAPPGEVTIRLATDGDACALTRLAGLDSRPLPPAPLLVASLDGEPAVALSLRDRSFVADPFRPTAALVGLLALRAAQLRSAGPASPGPATGLALVPAVER